MSGVVNYLEKGYGLWLAIRAAGHTLDGKDGVYTADDPVAVQAIIDAYDPLPEYKAAAVATIRATAYDKMRVVFPDVPNGILDLIAELWLSIKATSRAATSDWQKMVDVYTTAKSGIQSINAASDKAGVDAAVAAIAWPF